jgi:assimilatory nitrate reductase catalytic subunit
VFRGFVLSRKELALPASLWWARAAVTGGYGYLFADNAELSRWPSWLRATVAGDIAEYRDFGGGVFRAASFVGDQIEACLFVGPAHDAGDWDIVKGLFAAETLTDDERRMLLSGRSSEGAVSTGPVICACFGVGRASICDAIAAGANTAAEIGAKLKAGTNCGSCIPELKRLIAQTPVAPVPQRAAANH